MAKKAIFIIAQNNFHDQELFEPLNVLIKRGMEVKVAAPSKVPAQGKLGAEVEPDLGLAEIDVKKFDAIIFIGGPGARDYFENLDVLKLAQKFYQARKIVGAICSATSILANAGVLIGKTATGFPAEEENLRNRGADYTGMQVEVDGRVVTAKDPSAATEFGEKLAYLLEE